MDLDPVVRVTAVNLPNRHRPISQLQSSYPQELLDLLMHINFTCPSPRLPHLSLLDPQIFNPTWAGFVGE